jgi:hypothetical protein
VRSVESRGKQYFWQMYASQRLNQVDHTMGACDGEDKGKFSMQAHQLHLAE